MDPRLYRAAVTGNLSLLREVVAKPGLLLHNITTQKNNVLHIAVSSNTHSKEFVKNVICHCPSISAQTNSNGETPLHIAAKEGLSEMLFFLIQCLCNVNLDSAKATMELSKMRLLLDEYPLLYDLERGGPLRAVPHILEASPLSLYSGSASRTTLHRAIIADSLDIRLWAETFPEMIKKKDVYGWTPLHYASHFGFFLSVHILLAIDISCAYEADNNGMYGHLIAAHRGHVSVIREFYEHCPNCFALLDSQGRAALHIAAEAGESEVVWLLLEKIYHHTNLWGNRGCTHLLPASYKQNESILASLRNAPKVHESDVLGRQLEAFHVANKMPVQLQFEANSKQHGGAKIQTIGEQKLGPHFGASTDTNKAMQNVETHQILEIVSIAEVETPASQKVETHQSLEITSIPEEEIPTSQLETKVPRDSKEAMQKVEASQILPLPLPSKENEAREESQILPLPSKENEAGEARTDDVSRRLKDKANIHLLVATLIATVSFAAGINMPGGFKSDGMASLTKKAAFQVFVVSNSLAFCFSAASIAIHFMIIIERRIINRAVLLLCGLFLTFVGLIGMVTAFISAMIAVLAASVALWIASSIMGCCFFLVFYLIIGPPFRNRKMPVDVNELQQAGDGQEKEPSVLVNINEVHVREDVSRPFPRPFLYRLTSALISQTPVMRIGDL